MMDKTIFFDYMRKLSIPEINDKTKDLLLYDYSNKGNDIALMGFIKALQNSMDMKPSQFYKGVVDTFRPTKSTNMDLETFAFESAVNFANNLASDHILQIVYNVANFQPVTYGTSEYTGNYHDVYIRYEHLDVTQRKKLKSFIQKMMTKSSKTNSFFRPDVLISDNVTILNMISNRGSIIC